MDILKIRKSAVELNNFKGLIAARYFDYLAFANEDKEAIKYIEKNPIDLVSVKNSNWTIFDKIYEDLIDFGIALSIEENLNKFISLKITEEVTGLTNECLINKEINPIYEEFSKHIVYGETNGKS